MSERVAFQMYELRIDLKSGRQLCWHFYDISRAQNAFDTVAKAKVIASTLKGGVAQPAVYEFKDDARRDAGGDGAEIALYQLVDLQEEMIHNMRMGAFVGLVQDQLGVKRQPEVESQQQPRAVYQEEPRQRQPQNGGLISQVRPATTFAA
jgi:hypothetical protein